MITLHPAFRRLVLKKIPQLEGEDLDDYDSLLAYRWQLEQEISLASDKPDSERGTTSRKKIVRVLSATTRLANSIIHDYRPQFDKLHELWAARRNVALRQGGMLQIPRNLQELTTLVIALLKYYWVQISIFLPLTFYGVGNVLYPRLLHSLREKK